MYLPDTLRAVFKQMARKKVTDDTFESLLWPWLAERKRKCKETSAELTWRCRTQTTLSRFSALPLYTTSIVMRIGTSSFLPPTFSPNFVSNADGQVRYQLSRKSPILDFGEPVHQPFNSCSLFCLKQTRSAYWLALRGPIGRTTIPGSFAGLKCGGSQRPSCHSRSSLRHRLRIVGKLHFHTPCSTCFVGIRFQFPGLSV